MFAKPKYAEINELLATMDDPSSPNIMFDPISIDQIITAKRNDYFYAGLRRHFNKGESLSFVVDGNEILVGKGDRGKKIATPYSLRERILLINHYSKLEGHPVGRKIFHRIRRELYWPPLAVDFSATLRRCPHCACNRIKLRKNSGKLQSFQLRHH